MILATALLGLLVAGQASAKASPILQRRDGLEDMLRRDAEFLATLTQRQDANPAEPQISTTPASGDISEADLAKWEADTQAACNTALTSLNGQASNPTGLAVCYNLPFLDNQTGVFQAELRMYNISAPLDPWTGVTAGDINMGLSYLGATVQAMNGSVAKRDLTWPPVRRDVEGLSLVEERGLLAGRQANSGPQQLKVLMYVGRVNSNLMGSAMTQAQLQPLLVPQIQLSAINSRGEGVQATLSSQEASFVNGVFADQATSTNDGAAAASASAAVATAAPFVLPGTALAFFPTGLVITCVWTAGFLGAVGFGTVGRIQFREQYRRRVKREMALNTRTI